MTREQVINYLIRRGLSEYTVGEIVRALTYDPTIEEEYEYVYIGNGAYEKHYKPKTEAAEREEAIKQCEEFIKNHSDWSVEVEWANGVEFVLEDYKRLIKWESRMNKEKAIEILRADNISSYSVEDILSARDMAIKALEQEPFINKPCVSSGVCEHDKNEVLDKIRAEIKERTSNRGFLSCQVSEIHGAIDAIFDKYIAESED